jgi:hypothetical protein
MIFDQVFPDMLKQIQGIEVELVKATTVHPGRGSFEVRSLARPDRRVRFLGCPNHRECYHLIVLGAMGYGDEISKVPDLTLLDPPMPELCEQVPYARDGRALMAQLGRFLQTL